VDFKIVIDGAKTLATSTAAEKRSQPVSLRLRERLKNQNAERESAGKNDQGDLGKC